MTLLGNLLIVFPSYEAPPKLGEEPEDGMDDVSLCINTNDPDVPTNDLDPKPRSHMHTIRQLDQHKMYEQARRFVALI